MEKIMGWKERFIAILIMIILFLLMSKTQSMALFGPEIVDVTTKAFSVVWTNHSDYSDCGINLYADTNYTTLLNINQDQILIETQTGHPGKVNRIAKVTVTGLDFDTTYYFRPLMDGIELSFNGVVRTQKIRGLNPDDPNGTDIVSNDIVHKATYQSDGRSPALGILVLAEILDPGIYASNPNDHDAIITNYPISTWVGEGMIGDEASQEYDPDNISYKQYAALNMNNLFGLDQYPLVLHGDDPVTTGINEGEIIRFIIVRGVQDVFGQDPDQDWFTSYGHIGFLDYVNGERITTAKISASFRFKKGANAFAFPSSIPSGYTTGNLLEAIECAEGIEGIVESIYIYKDNHWSGTYKTCTQIINPNPIQYGSGVFIIMNQNMINEVSFYGDPESVTLNLFSDAVNIISLPQLPVFYETRHLLNDIESGGAGENSVENIWYYDGGWKRTYKIDHPQFGAQIQNSVLMSNTTFYVVLLKDNASDLLNFDPFSMKKRARLQSSNLIFFY